jgi:hypothetical protein
MENIGAHRIREICVRACADPRTVRRYLIGERLLGATQVRIERAMEELGIPARARARRKGAAR